MQITGKGIVYKNEYGYSITDSQKQQDGTYIKFYISCRFRNGVEVENGTMIEITKGFTKPFKRKDGTQGMSYFINEFVECEAKPKQAEKSEQPNFEGTQKYYGFDKDLPF